MHNHYIINGFIEFHPAASTLRNLNDPEKVVVLNSPAGRCLLLLIQRIDTIVTQQEFMETVWEKNGMLVSPNTFYQNISILRKGLKKIGLPEDPVMTIPRVGLTLASGTQIKKRCSENLVNISHEHTQFIDEHSLAQDTSEQDTPKWLPDDGHFEPVSANPDMQLAPETVTALPYTQLHSEPTQISIPQSSIQKKPSFYPLGIMGLIAMILLFFVISVPNTSYSASQYFIDYRFLTDANGCHIFIVDKNTNMDDKTRTVSLIDNSKTRCSDYPWVYVTHYVMLPRVSVIRCNNQIGELSSCISEYYFRGLKDGA